MAKTRATRWKVRWVGCAGFSGGSFYYNPQWARRWVMQQGTPTRMLPLVQRVQRGVGRAVLWACEFLTDNGEKVK